MRVKFPRDFYIPSGAVKITHKRLPAIVYLATTCNGRPCAVGFYGKANKPSFNYQFRYEERRAQAVAEWFKRLEEIEASKKARREQRSAYVHDVKAGDIFRSSWGYDQTNIDYYQIVRLIGAHMAEVREIQQQRQETAWQQGDCVPAPGHWATEADYSEAGEKHKAEHGYYPQKNKASFRVKIQGEGSSGPYFKVASYANAYRVKPLTEIAGAKVYGSSHWTAYH